LCNDDQCHQRFFQLLRILLMHLDLITPTKPFVVCRWFPSFPLWITLLHYTIVWNIWEIVRVKYMRNYICRTILGKLFLSLYFILTLLSLSLSLSLIKFFIYFSNKLITLMRQLSLVFESRKVVLWWTFHDPFLLLWKPKTLI
jgi:hypothetical protein